MNIPGYDEWKLATPWDEYPAPCECGDADCTCAEDAYWDHIACAEQD